MKNESIFWVLALSVMLAFSACKSNRVPVTDDGQPQSQVGSNGDFQKPAAMGQELSEKYIEDAYRLALRDMLTRGGTGEDQADISKERAVYYYDKLVKAWQIFSSVDTIPDLSYLHTWAHPSLHRVIVALEDDASFRDTWSQGRTTTSNLYLNQVIAKYRLKIENYRETPQGPVLQLVTQQHINTPSLAIMLAEVSGIKYAEPDGISGDGDDIIVAPEGKNAVALKYSIGAGDCPSGCIHRKYWVFYIQPDGSVDYVGERGEIPPDLMEQRGEE